ncbi:MAG: glycosyltransferase family 39 protein [bacterium]|nr:MAG: glycosyltransferase family 39 protein [bacterium]
MTRARPRPVVIFLVCSVLFLAGLGSSSLWDVDETRNARAAEEMMQRGDLVVPTVNGEVRAHKPPLHYWFMILAYKLFGVREFSARVFAALFGLGTVLLVTSVGVNALGSGAGLLAGLVLGVSFLFTVSSRSATTDAFLVFFTNAAVLAGYFSSRGRLWTVAAWAAMGFAVLAKGPVGVVLPLGALILFRLTDGHGPRGLLGLFHPAGILVFVAIAAPWYVLAAARTEGDLVAGFFLKHNVGRFLKPMESHGGPIYYYLAILLPGFFPWAAFLPQALSHGFRSPRFAGRFPGFLRLQVIWAGVVLVFFSLARTKLPNYILPAFPALALLTGAWIDSLGASPKVGFRGRTVSWLVTLLPAAFFPALFTVALTMRAPEFVSLAWLSVPLAAAGLVGLVGHLRRMAPSPVFRAVAYTTAVGELFIHFFLVPRLEPLRMAPRLGRAVSRTAGPSDTVASLGFSRPALYFYGKRPVVRVGDEAAVRAFLAEPGGRFLVATEELFGRLPADVRGSLKVLESGLDALDTNAFVLVAERVGPGAGPGVRPPGKGEGKDGGGGG